MTRSSRLFLFPDINVWVALTYDAHIHHVVARKWFDGLPPTARLFFCRFTQLGLLRLLSAAAVMGTQQVKSQQEAWRAYDRWLEDERVEFLDEPPGVEAQFRSLTRSVQASPKEWADSYLAAFAQASRLTIVTFDRAFQAKAKDLILLGA
ncbi:MAG TPA: TA system VapC family ribonuclease toxin [Candidatus Acidoferrum sp.]|nr:TA system VapC family ribonuclease toxin [Candidatus Acidoferrum sp.]